MADEPIPPCVTPLDFPRRPRNRPALPRVRYRIGAYPQFRAAILRALDESTVLSSWTHRAPDDPGIALVEGAAILGDILSFYQEHYAQEVWLRTAQWRESVADLTRLLGYRLTPGLGGLATFAVTVKQPLTLAARHPIKAELADGTSADFETRADLVAHPQLGRFHLYRDLIHGGTLPAGDTVAELTAIGGARDALTLQAFDLKRGDRLMLVPAEPAWVLGSDVLGPPPPPAQIVKVAKVTHALGRTTVEFESPLQSSWPAPVRAYRLGRTFRHFGHNAPPTYHRSITDSAGKIIGTTEQATAFWRYVGQSSSGWSLFDGANKVTAIPADICLDRDLTDLVPGLPSIVQAHINYRASSYDLSLVRTVAAHTLRTLSFGDLTAAASWLTLSQVIAANKMVEAPWTDVRSIQVHETTSLELQLAPVATHPGGAFGPASTLTFFGTAAEVAPLAGRRLMLRRARDGAIIDTTVATTAFTLPAGAPVAAPRRWPLQFTTPPAPLRLEDFDETAPAVEVFGNVVDATQGKSEAEVVLGNGDARLVFQTFPLPKKPLTYLLDPAATPPAQPELHVWVAGREWQRVESFYGRAADEQIYVVREDAEGGSYVQFGDGLTGSRLPSGLDNVVAVYRSGSGAHGPAKPGADPSTPKKPPGLEKLFLLPSVVGGSAPEDAEQAREAAPGKVQALGRLVSLRDYETETLALPGVVTATAAWGLHEGAPAVLLRVLLAAGREDEFGTASVVGSVAAAIAQATQRRGPDNFPVIATQAFLRHVYLTISYAADAALRPADVETAVRAALGLAGDETHARRGLFGLRARRLGAPEFATRIAATVQQVPGIVWCRLTHCGRLGSHLADPANTPWPVPPQRREVLACGAGELLQLHPAHLALMRAAP